jgi:hypothetical protein
MNTAELQDLLAARYPRDRYALFFNVPDAIGMDANRRADAIAVGLWRSVGRAFEGFELKVSRSDWLRELAQVEKADPFIEHCDRWWLVTADAEIAKLEELPACWGWLAAGKAGLRVHKPAPLKPQQPATIDRRFALGLMRKLQDAIMESPEVRQALARNEAAAEEQIAMRVRQELARNGCAQAVARIEAFEKASGMKLEDWRLGDVGELALRIARYHDQGYGSVTRRLKYQEEELERLRKQTKDLREALEAQT